MISIFVVANLDSKVSNINANTLRNKVEYLVKENINKLRTECNWTIIAEFDTVNQSCEALVNSLQNIIKQSVKEKTFSSKSEPIKPWMTSRLIKSIIGIEIN